MWVFCCAQCLLSHSSLEKVNKHHCFLNHHRPNLGVYASCDVDKQKQIHNSTDFPPCFSWKSNLGLTLWGLSNSTDRAVWFLLLFSSGIVIFEGRSDHLTQGSSGNLSLTQAFPTARMEAEEVEVSPCFTCAVFTFGISLVYSFKAENPNQITQDSGSFWAPVKNWLYLRFILREELYIKSLCLSINNFVVNHLDSTWFEKLNIEWVHLSVSFLPCLVHTS